jgi:hypothetical protein
MSHRKADLELLRKLCVEHEEDLSEDELSAFKDMWEGLDPDSNHDHQLTEKQRAWAKKTLDRYQPEYENLVSEGKVPRGKEVESMVGSLPKKPPQRRSV